MIKLTKWCVYLGILLVYPLASKVTAQTEKPQMNPPAEGAANLYPKFSPRFGVRYTTDGPGFDSFTSFEGFLPFIQAEGSNSLTFLEGRLLLDNSANLGGNIMLGQRLYVPAMRRVFGGYLAFDKRDTGNGVFNQFGIGLETLGDWDFRINGYLPTGDTRRQKGETVLSNLRFQQNSLLLDRTRQFESAATGFDTEVGARVARVLDGDVRAYGGVYYYAPEGNRDAFGYKFRLEARPTEYTGVSLSVQNDRLFGTKAILSLAVNFPGSAASSTDKKRGGFNRMGESIERTAAIVVDKQREVAQAIPINNPATGQPFRFQHVELGKTGDGTIEKPTGTVQDALKVAQANDIVYVRSGTNPGIPAFTLPNGAQLLSSGPVQRIDTAEFGSIQLPGSGTGVRPKIIGTLTLGNNNTISGFDITSATGSGIQGTNISNPTIRENTIAGSAGAGILLNTVTGNTTISNNTFGEQTFNRTNPGAPNTTLAYEAIRLEETTGTVAISNNSFKSTFAATNFIPRTDNSVFVQNTKGQLNLTVATNNIQSNNGVSVNLAGTATETANITNNQITTSATGVEMNVRENGNLTATLSGNTITGTSTSTEGIILRASDSAQATVTASNNQVRNINGTALDFQGSQQSKTQITASGNTIDSAKVGINADAIDDADMTIAISNNNITNSSEVGIEPDARDNAKLRITLDSNQITNSAKPGISVFVQGNSQVLVRAENNTLTNNNTAQVASSGFDVAVDPQGIDAAPLNKAKVCVRLANNKGTGNRVADFSFFNNDPTSAKFEIENLSGKNNTGTVKFEAPYGTPSGPVSISSVSSVPSGFSTPSGGVCTTR